MGSISWRVYPDLGLYGALGVGLSAKCCWKALTLISTCFMSSSGVGLRDHSLGVLLLCNHDYRDCVKPPPSEGLSECS